jgi:tellurite resistance protein TerA
MAGCRRCWPTSAGPRPVRRPRTGAGTRPCAGACGCKVSLSKITLEKRGDKVSLDKRAGQGYGRIHVNLNWNQSPLAPAPGARRKTGFFERISGAVSGAVGGAAGNARKGRGGIDLDLGCMYELADGRRGAVQALGNSFGDYDSAPFVRLDADDRTGAAAGGENLFINGERFDQIKRALIFSFIYEGVPNWSSTDGVVTIAAPGQAPIEVRLDGGDRQMMCAIAMIENRSGALVVTKLAEYFQQQGSTSAHELMDRHYGFGMRYRAGSK